MSLNPLYCQPELWRPPRPDVDVQSLAQIYREGRKIELGFNLDVRLACALAQTTHKYFGDTLFLPLDSKLQSRNYRAGKAIDPLYKSGNCFAHAEGTGVIGQINGLDMRIHFNGRHASTYWYTDDTVWEVDGQLRMAKKRYGDSAELHAEHLAADQKFGSRMIWNKNDNTFQGIPGPIGDVSLREVEQTIILSVEEGVLMLGAIGDLRRYIVKRNRETFVIPLSNRVTDSNNCAH